MQGNQLAQQRRAIRAIETSPSGLPVAKTVGRWHKKGPTDEEPFKSLFQKMGWAFLF